MLKFKGLNITLLVILRPPDRIAGRKFRTLPVQVFSVINLLEISDTTEHAMYQEYLEGYVRPAADRRKATICIRFIEMIRKRKFELPAGIWFKEPFLELHFLEVLHFMNNKSHARMRIYIDIFLIFLKFYFNRNICTRIASYFILFIQNKHETYIIYINIYNTRICTIRSKLKKAVLHYTWL